MLIQIVVFSVCASATKYDITTQCERRTIIELNHCLVQARYNYFQMRRSCDTMRCFMFVLCLSSAIGADKGIHRAERQINSLPLVYPYGGTYKLLIGFASPVPNKDKINLLFGVNFQYQYLQFQNISQLSQYYFVKQVPRMSRDVNRGDERLLFYKSLADMMNAQDMNGPECVLRAICEAAQFPLEEEGFMGEILLVLLTPDFGRTPFDDEDSDPELAPYKDAAVTGRQMFSCPAVYDACPEGQGVMELISTLRDE